MLGKWSQGTLQSWSWGLAELHMRTQLKMLLLQPEVPWTSDSAQAQAAPGGPKVKPSLVAQQNKYMKRQSVCSPCKGLGSRPSAPYPINCKKRSGKFSAVYR